MSTSGQSFIKRSSILVRDPSEHKVFWLQKLDRANAQESGSESELIAAFVEQRAGSRRHLDVVRVPGTAEGGNAWLNFETAQPLPRWKWQVGDSHSTGFPFVANDRPMVFENAVPRQSEQTESRYFPHDWVQVRSHLFQNTQQQPVDGEFSARLWHPRILGGWGLPRLVEFQFKFPSGLLPSETLSIRGLERWFGHETSGHWNFVIKRHQWRIEGSLRAPFKDFWTYRTEDSDGVPFYVSQNFFASLTLRFYQNGILKDSLLSKDLTEVESGTSEKLPHHEDVR